MAAQLTVKDLSQSIALQIAERLNVEPNKALNNVVEKLSIKVAEIPFKSIQRDLEGMYNSLISIQKLLTNSFDSNSSEKDSKFPNIFKINFNKIKETLAEQTKEIKAQTSELKDFSVKPSETVTAEPVDTTIKKAPEPTAVRIKEQVENLPSIVKKPAQAAAEVQQTAQERKSLIAKDETVNVRIIGYSQEGMKVFTELLPSILSEKFKGLFKFPAEKEQKKESGGPGSLLEGFKQLGALAGLVTLIYGLQTEGPLKGLAKLASTGLLKVSGFNKLVQGFADNIINYLLKLPKTLIRNFSKSIAGIFGKEVGVAALKTGLGALKGFIPRMLEGALKLLKKVPFVGTLISLGFAVSRFKSGDYVGGGIEVLSGIAGLFPGVGTAIAIGLDALNAVLDVKTGGSTPEASAKKEGIMTGWVGKLVKYGAMFLKKVPFIGSVISLGYAVSRFKNGDILGGGLEILSGIAGLFPGVGTVVMLGIDLLNTFLDTQTEDGKQTKGQAIGNWLGKIGSWIASKIHLLPIIGPLLKAGKHFIAGEWLKGLKQLAYIVPLFEFVGGLLGDTEAESIAGQGGQAIGGMLKSPFKALREMILNKAKEWWKSINSGIRFLAEKVLPDGIVKMLNEGNVSKEELKSTAPTQEPQQQEQPKAAPTPVKAEEPIQQEQPKTAPTRGSSLGSEKARQIQQNREKLKSQTSSPVEQTSNSVVSATPVKAEEPIQQEQPKAAPITPVKAEEPQRSTLFKTINKIVTGVKTDLSLVSLTTKAEEAWQKQDIKELKQIRNSVKKLKNLKTDKQLDEFLATVKGNTTLEGLSVLSTRNIGSDEPESTSESATSAQPANTQSPSISKPAVESVASDNKQINKLPKWTENAANEMVAKPESETSKKKLTLEEKIKNQEQFSESLKEKQKEIEKEKTTLVEKIKVAKKGENDVEISQEQRNAFTKNREKLEKQIEQLAEVNLQIIREINQSDKNLQEGKGWQTIRDDFKKLNIDDPELNKNVEGYEAKVDSKIINPTTDNKKQEVDSRPTAQQSVTPNATPTASPLVANNNTQQMEIKITPLLEKLSTNSDNSNVNMTNLAAGFNNIAKALEKVGAAIGEKIKVPPVVVQNVQKPQQQNTMTATQVAKQGNPVITEFRGMVENYRPIPA